MVSTKLTLSQGPGAQEDEAKTHELEVDMLEDHDGEGISRWAAMTEFLSLISYQVDKQGGGVVSTILLIGVGGVCLPRALFRRAPANCLSTVFFFSALFFFSAVKAVLVSLPSRHDLIFPER